MTVLAERLLIGALAWGALSFGAVYPWGYWPLAIVCGAVGVHLIVVTRAWQNPRTNNLGLALGVLALAITAQVIAVPYSLVEVLSPAVDRFFREYQLAYHPAARHPLSIDVSSTIVALALFVAFALLLVGLIAALRASSLHWLLNQVLGLGVALAVLGVIQLAFPGDDPGRPVIYGFWKPQQPGTPFGPFVNRNHFAGWMIMALPLVVGYSCATLAETWRAQHLRWTAQLRWVTSVDGSRVVLVIFSALLMGMALALTRSRSGIGGFVVAIAVFGCLAIRRVTQRHMRVLLAGYLALLLAGAIVWAGTDVAVGRFASARVESVGRLSAWSDTLRIVSDFPWFGTGLGTYSQAMLVYQTEGRPRMYAQAHNDYLQLVAEGGLLIAAPAAVVLSLVIAGIRRRLIAGADDVTTFWIRAGAIAGLAGIAAQSVVEFSLQMPGNRVLFILLLAIALHRPRGSAPSPSRRRHRTSAHMNANRV